MATELETYVRRRARSLGLSLAKVCEGAGFSRQTLYDCWRTEKMPSIHTVVALAWALKVHPLRLFQLIFSEQPISNASAINEPGDMSAFVEDVTYPDGDWVVANRRFRKTWLLQNVGKIAWEDRFLTCIDDEITVFSGRGEELKLAPNLVPDSHKIPIPLVKPGETVELSADFQAPGVPGTVLSYWKMTFPDGSFCFPESRGVWVKVRVVTPTMAAGEAGERASTS